MVRRKKKNTSDSNSATNNYPIIKDADYELYTDGGQRIINGNNIGAYAAYIHSNDPSEQVMIVGAEENTTNNRMELCGVIEGLASLPENSIVNVYSDSQYVVHAFTKNWIANWQKREFNNVKNKELWIALLDEVDKHKSVNFTWVKGHSSNDRNNLCDRLATAAMYSIKKEEEN